MGAQAHRADPERPPGGRGAALVRRRRRRTWRSAASPRASPSSCAASTSAIFTPHVDTGDFVVVVNAEKVQAHRQQARAEDLPPPHRLDRPREVDHGRQGARGPARRARARERRARHAPEELARPADVPQAQGLRRARASARGPAAGGPRPCLSPSAVRRATGKRKTAVARVRLKLGTGQIRVNGRTLEDYFPREALAHDHATSRSRR